jgi:allophanate hydrolase
MSGAFGLAAGRVPAMFNGCVGVKPTVGRLSTRGVVPAARALDCVTVFSQTVADGAAVARLMEVRACPRGRHYGGTML